MMVGELNEETLGAIDRIQLLADKELTKLLNEEPQRWNTMKDMRKALGLPLGNDGIAEFLEFWDSLNQAQRIQFRRGDLNNIDQWNFHRPNANKENT
jgi:hypothetical protein